MLIFYAKHSFLVNIRVVVYPVPVYVDAFPTMYNVLSFHNDAFIPNDIFEKCLVLAACVNVVTFVTLPAASTAFRVYMTDALFAVTPYDDSIPVNIKLSELNVYGTFTNAF